MNPFSKTILPDTRLMIGGVEHFTLTQVAKFLGVCPQTMHIRCNDGTIATIFAPGLKNKKRLISAIELERFLSTQTNVAAV